MVRASKRDPKSAALAQDGVLNPNPEAVRDRMFTSNPFFDAKDLVQVRYEMVRRHQVDGIAISEAAATFGVTRPTFYKAQSTLQTAGLPGLLPSSARSQRRPQGLSRGDCVRGRPQSCQPRGDHFAMSRGDRGTLRRQGASTQSGARAGAQKKTTQSVLIVPPADARDRYEQLRAAVLRTEPAACPGLGILRRRGLAAWIRALGREPHVEAACCDHRPALAVSHDPSPAPNDITRLLASILVAIAMEPIHA